MKSIVCMDSTDYMKIAALINEKSGDESSNYDIEYQSNGYSLFVEVEHVVEYREEIGGSYEFYDFERIPVAYNEKFEISNATIYDENGCCVDCDFDAHKLCDIIN